LLSPVAPEGWSLVRDGIVQLFCPKPHPADLKGVFFFF
jgi:hypothetical protein